MTLNLSEEMIATFKDACRSKRDSLLTTLPYAENAVKQQRDSAKKQKAIDNLALVRAKLEAIDAAIEMLESKDDFVSSKGAKR